MGTPWYQNPDLYEYFRSDTAWLLGIVIILVTYWTNQQIELYDKHKASTEITREPTTGGPSANDASPNSESDSKTNQPSPPNGFDLWRQPYITWLLVKALIISSSGVIVLFELLEGSWIVKTTWRITTGVLRATYPRMKPYILGFIIYLPITGVILAAWVVVTVLGLYILSIQLLFMLKLLEFQDSSQRRLLNIPSIEEEKENHDEWDEVGDLNQ
jgi:hypothetical protein